MTLGPCDASVHLAWTEFPLATATKECKFRVDIFVCPRKLVVDTCAGVAAATDRRPMERFG